MKCRCRTRLHIGVCMASAPSLCASIREGNWEKARKAKTGSPGSPSQLRSVSQVYPCGQPGDGAQKYDVVKPVHSSSPCLLIQQACWGLRGLQGLTAPPPSFDVAGATSLAASHGDCTLSECNTFAIASSPLLFQ